MNICVIGSGYVGLVAGVCLADTGNSVICVDNNEQKINMLNSCSIPIFEPGLEELLKLNKKENRLSFSIDLKSAVEKSDVCFIAVGTPQDNNGNCDLSFIYSVAKEIGKYINDYKVIVNKSTVPVGTLYKLQEIIKSNANAEFDIVSNPEFLKQGAAVNDFLHPDRVIIGTDSKKAAEIMKKIYTPFCKKEDKIIFMDVKSAEMTKYASNAFLAAKISFINEIANICEKAGADIQKVKEGMTSDKRIGNSFFNPGIGYGGSCFPKDIDTLINVAEEICAEIPIIKSVKETNEKQRERFINKITDCFSDNFINKTIAIWGLAFKPNTNDMREAPSINVINALLKKGAKLKVYDPKAMNSAKSIFGDKIIYAKNAYEALYNADAMLLLTEWEEFRSPDVKKMKSLMKESVIFDARYLYNKTDLEKEGFKYIR